MEALVLLPPKKNDKIVQARVTHSILQHDGDKATTELFSKAHDSIFGSEVYLQAPFLGCYPIIQDCLALILDFSDQIQTQILVSYVRINSIAMVLFNEMHQPDILDV